MNTLAPSAYSEFGLPDEGYSVENEALTCCLSGGFINCPNEQSFGLCPQVMRTKCANNWDESCEEYLASLEPIERGKFTENVAGSKYCTLSPDSACVVSCEKFDPIAQDSIDVCSYKGRDVLVENDGDIDVGYGYNVELSPYYIQSCKQVCSSTLQVEDKVLDYCLQFGKCGKILDEICATTNIGSITNKNLLNYCQSRFIADLSTTSPALIPAVSPPSFQETRIPTNPPIKYSSHAEVSSEWDIKPLIYVLIFVAIISLFIYFSKNKTSKF